MECDCALLQPGKALAQIFIHKAERIVQGDRIVQIGADNLIGKHIPQENAVVAFACCAAQGRSGCVVSLCGGCRIAIIRAVRIQQQAIFGLVLNNIMPAFFLLIPIMASSVMATSSFVGEKEKRTLETLLYSPLSLRQLFRAKILAGFSVGMIVSCISFAAMLLVLELEAFFLTGALIMPGTGWLAVMLLVSPAISLIAIAVTVRGSAKAQTVEEAQQRAVFLVFPIIALLIGQFTGVILINSGLLWGLGAGLAALDVLLMRGAAGNFSYEKLLK